MATRPDGHPLPELPGHFHSEYVVLGQDVAHRLEAAHGGQVGPAERHRLADHDVPSGQPLDRDGGRPDGRRGLQVVQRRPEGLLAHPAHRVGDEPDARLGQVARHVLQVAVGRAHVRVAHQQHVVAGRGGEADELVHLGVQARLAALDHQAEPARPAAHGLVGHPPGRVAPVPDPEDHLVGRVVEGGEGGEVGLEVVVHPAERLQDGDGRQRAGLPGGGAQVQPEEDELDHRGDEPQRRHREQDRAHAHLHGPSFRSPRPPRLPGRSAPAGPRAAPPRTRPASAWDGRRSRRGGPAPRWCAPPRGAGAAAGPGRPAGRCARPLSKWDDSA